MSEKNVVSSNAFPLKKDICHNLKLQVVVHYLAFSKLHAQPELQYYVFSVAAEIVIQIFPLL